MENPDRPLMTVNQEMLIALNETRKWTMFIAILGFISIGFMIIASLFVGTFLNLAGGEMPFPSIYLTVIYILIGLVYFFPVYFLYQFSVKTKNAIVTGTSEDLSSAFINLKSHYKFIGILLIIMLAFYVLAFIIGLIGGAMTF